MALERNHLKDMLVFPVDVYLKENGFLGILGYDSSKAEFVIASKSSTHSTFSDAFRNLFYQTLKVDDETKLMKLLHDKNVGMVFEVIDPIFDPHIISYPSAKIILLDVIYRTREFKKYSYEEVEKVGATFSFQVKPLIHRFYNWNDFYAWYSEVSNDFSLQIEGYVIEDSNGFMTKMKLPYYRFWKWMRSMKDRVAKRKGLPNEVAENPLAYSFCKWAESKRDEIDLSQTDIITLRNLFEKEMKIEK